MAKIRKPSKLSKPSKRRKPLSAAAKQKISQGLARVLGPTRGIDEYKPKPKKGTKANKPDAPKTGKSSIPDNLPNSQPLTRKQTRTEGNRPTPKPQRLERPKRPTTLKELTRPQLIAGLEYHRERGNKDSYNRIKEELNTRPTPNAKTSTPDTQIANDQRILQGYEKRQAQLRLEREAEARAVLEARGVDTSEWEPIDEDVMNRARKRVERDIQKDTAQRAERRQQREAEQQRRQQILERQAEARVILEARGQDTSDWHGIDPELMEAARLRLADQIANDSTARNAKQARQTRTTTPSTPTTARTTDATPQINTKAIPTVPKTNRKPQPQPTHPNYVEGGGHQASAAYLNPKEIRKEPHYEDDLNQLNAQLAESPTAQQKLLERLNNAQQRAADNRTNAENRHNQREATRLQVLAEDSGLIPNSNKNDPMNDLDDQELDDFNDYMAELDARDNTPNTDTTTDADTNDAPTPNNMPTTRPGMTEDEKDTQYFTAESQYDPDYEEFLEWQRREHSEPLRNESEETADVDNLDTTTDAPELSDEELEQRLNQRDNDDTTPDVEPENPTPPAPTTTPDTEPATPRPQATTTPDTAPGTEPAPQPTTTPAPAERPAPTTRKQARPEPGTPDALSDEEQKEFDKQAEKEFRKQFTNQSDDELIAELSELNPRHPRAQALNRELDLRDEDTTSENSNTYLRERSGRGNQGRRQPANTGETPNYNDENQLEQLETANQQDTDRDQFNTQELQYMTFDELDAIDTTDVDPVYAAAVDDAKETINPEHPGGILDSLKQNSTFTDYKRRLTDYDGIGNYVQEGEDLNTTDKDQRAALNKRIDDRIKTSLGLAGNPRFAREAEQTEEYFDWENDLFTTQTNADGTIDDIREAGGRLKQGQTGRYGTVDEAETQISTEVRDHIINNIGYLPNVENFQRIKRGQAPIPYTEDTAKEIRAERNARARQRPYKTKAQRAAAREQKIFNQNTRAPELERRQAQELQPAEGLEGVGVRAGRKAIMQPDLPQDMRDRPWEKQERIDLIQRHADTLNDKDLLQAVDNAKEDNGFGLGTQDIEETYRAEATKRGLIDAPEPETPAQPAAEPEKPAKAPEPAAPKPTAKPATEKPTAKSTKTEPKATAKPATAKPAAAKDAPKTTTKPDTTNPQAKYSKVRKAVIAKNGTPINNQKALKAMSDDDLNTAKTHAEQLKAKNPKSKQHQAVIDAVEKEITTRNKPAPKPTKPTPKPAAPSKPAAAPAKPAPAKPAKPAETKDAPKPTPAAAKPAKPAEAKDAPKPTAKPAETKPAPAPAKPAETKPAATKDTPKLTKYQTQVAQAHENYTPDTKEKDLAHRLTGAATKELNSPTKDQQITKVIEEQHDKTQLLDRHPQLKEVYEALQKRNQQQTKTQERRHNIAQALTNDAGTGARQNPDLTKYTDKDLQDFIDNPQSTLKISQGGKGKVFKQEAPADKLKAAAQRELKKRQQATSFDDAPTTPATPKKTTTPATGTVAERAKAHTKNIDQKLYKAKTNFDTTRRNHAAGTPEFEKAEREYIELNVESAKQHRDFEQQELDTRKQNGQPTKAQQKRLDRTEANLQKAQQKLDTLNELRDNFAKSEAKKKTQTTTPPKGDTGLSFDDAPDQPDTTPASQIDVNTTQFKFNGHTIHTRRGKAEELHQKLTDRNYPKSQIKTTTPEIKPNTTTGTYEITNLQQVLGLDRVEGEAGTHRNGQYIGAIDYQVLTELTAEINPTTGKVTINNPTTSNVNTPQLAQDIETNLQKHGGITKLINTNYPNSHISGQPIKPNHLTTPTGAKLDPDDYPTGAIRIDKNKVHIGNYTLTDNQNGTYTISSKNNAPLDVGMKPTFNSINTALHTIANQAGPTHAETRENNAQLLTTIKRMEKIYNKPNLTADELDRIRSSDKIKDNTLKAIDKVQQLNLPEYDQKTLNTLKTNVEKIHTPDTPTPTKTGTPTTHKWNEPYKTTLTDGAETRYYHTSDWNEPHTPSDNMAVWNSQRPLQGQYTWQGQGRYGQYYAATPTNDADYTTHNTNNLNLNSERIELVDNNQSLELADQRLQDLRGMTLQQARDNGATDRDLMNMVGLPYNQHDAEKQRIQTQRRELYNQEQHQASATELTKGLQQAHRQQTIGNQSRFTTEGRAAVEKFNREHPLASYEELANKIREQEWADFQNADDNYLPVSVNQLKDRNALNPSLTDEYTDAANKNGGFPTSVTNTPQPTTSDPKTTPPALISDADLIAEYTRLKGDKQARQADLGAYTHIITLMRARGLVEPTRATATGTSRSVRLTKTAEEINQRNQPPAGLKHIDGIKYMEQTPTYDAPNPRKKQDRIQQVEEATSKLAKQMKHGDEPILVKTGDAGFYVKPIGKNQYRVWAPGKEYEAKTVRYDEPGGARWAPFYDLIDQTTPQKHTAGEPFTTDHKAPGEKLNNTGSLRRGDYTIVSTPDGYQILENFGSHKITKPYKQTLSAIRKKIDQMPGNTETN